MSNDSEKYATQRYLDGSMPEQERLSYEESLSKDPDSRELAEYRALQSLEQFIAAQNVSLDQDLTKGVLDRISAMEQSTPGLTVANDPETQKIVSVAGMRKIYTGLISLNAMLLLLLGVLITKIPSTSSQQQLVQDTSETFTTVALELPLSEKEASKMKRVDLQVAYTDGEVTVRRKLARFIPVVDVQPVHDSALAQSRVYIAVPHNQLKHLQLARLFGEVEVSPIDTSTLPQVGSEPVVDPQGRLIKVAGQESPRVLYYRHYPTASTERLVYRGGSWIPQPEVNIQAF